MDDEALLPQTPAILAHYERAVKFLVASFEGTPLCVSFFPHGLDGTGQFVSARHRPLPPSIGSVVVQQRSGQQTYVALEQNSLLWLVHRGAVCIYSWSPKRGDPQRVGFARILVQVLGRPAAPLLARGLLGIKAALEEQRLDGIPMRAGAKSAVWIPFSDGPLYPPVATWLGGFVAGLASAQPDLYTLRSDDAPERLHLSVTTNHVGRFSSFPYGLLAEPALGMVTPFAWGDIDAALATEICGAFFAREGDVFAREAARIGAQPFGDRTPVPIEAAALESLRAAEDRWQCDVT